MSDSPAAIIYDSTGTNAAAVKPASTAPLATDPSLVVSISPNSTLTATNPSVGSTANAPPSSATMLGGSFHDAEFNAVEVDPEGRLRTTGGEGVAMTEPFDGGSLQASSWTVSQSTMTQSSANTGLTLNANSTLTSGAYSIASTTKQIFYYTEYPLYVGFKARFIYNTNGVTELGWGTVSGVSAPSGGVFVRMTAAGALYGVINYAGTETTVLLAAAGTLSTTNYYGINIYVNETTVAFDVETNDGSFDVDVILNIPATQASVTATARNSIFARVYNSALATTATQLIISVLNVSQIGLNNQFSPDTTYNVNVNASASNVTLLPLNQNRDGATVFNDSSATLYLKLGVTASTTSFTARLSPFSYYEVPFGFIGQIDGIWTAATGAARVTELF